MRKIKLVGIDVNCVIQHKETQTCTKHRQKLFRMQKDPCTGKIKIVSICEDPIAEELEKGCTKCQK